MSRFVANVSSGAPMLAYRLLVVVAFFVGCQPTPGNRSESRDSSVTLANSNSTSTISTGADVSNERGEVVGAEPPTDANPVSAAAEIAAATIRPGDSVLLNIRVRIAPGWHIYGLNGGLSPNHPTQIELSLPTGISAIGEWKAPAPDAQVTSLGLASIYSGEVVFSRQLIVSHKYQPEANRITCKLRFQACDHARCLRPDVLNLTVPLQVIPDKE
jgi:DsbC/DsbD-like thiol-disulfide interchange protein